MSPSRTPNAAQSLKQLSALPHPPFLLHIVTPDEVRFRRALSTALASRPDLQNAELTRLRASDITNADLVKLQDQSLSLSLFSSFRVFVLERADSLPTALEKTLIKQLSHPIPNVTFLVWSHTLSSSSPWRKLQSQILIELEALRGQELRRWTMRECAQQGIESPSSAVIDRIIELAGELPDTVARYCEQLALYLDGEPCTLEHLQRLFLGHAETDDFALVGMINRSNPLQAHLQVHQMLAGGSNPFPTIAMIAKNLSQYLVIKLALAQRKPPASIRQDLAIQPWLFQKHIDAVKHYSLDQLFAASRMVVAADSRLKGRSLGAEHVLIDFVAALAHRNMEPYQGG